MKHIQRLSRFVQPYRLLALLSLLTLITMVFLDLAIPRLIQRLIDQGIPKNDPGVVIQSAAIMLVISALSLGIAIANNKW